MKRIPVFEHDYEPVPGLPARLPDGEFIVWQGHPEARSVGRRIVKTRWVAGYFLVLAAWSAAAGLHDGMPLGGVIFSVAAISFLGAIVIALLELYAWGVEKTTLYTITNRRLVMRIGVALSLTLNLPFRQIASADMRRDRDGTGDIVFELNDGQRPSWLMLWPHVRPWRMTKPQPALRCVPNVEAIASILRAELLRLGSDKTAIPALQVTRPAAPQSAAEAALPAMMAR